MINTYIEKLNKFNNKPIEDEDKCPNYFILYGLDIVFSNIITVCKKYGIYELKLDRNNQCFSHCKTKFFSSVLDDGFWETWDSLNSVDKKEREDGSFHPLVNELFEFIDSNFFMVEFLYPELFNNSGFDYLGENFEETIDFIGRNIKKDKEWIHVDKTILGLNGIDDCHGSLGVNEAFWGAIVNVFPKDKEEFYLSDLEEIYSKIQKELESF